MTVVESLILASLVPVTPLLVYHMNMYTLIFHVAMIEFGRTLPLVGVTTVQLRCFSIAKESLLKFVSKNQWKVAMFKVMGVLLCEGG